MLYIPITNTKEHRVSDSAIATSSTTPAKAKTKKNRLSGSFFRFVLTRFLLIIRTAFFLVPIVLFVMHPRGRL